MRRIVVTEFISLDGVVEDPGGAEGYRHGGWTFKFNGPEGMKYKVEETFQHDAMLLGRVTYEGFAAAWPTIDAGEFSEKMNGMRKYVFSSTITDPTWNNTAVLSGDLVSEITTIRNEPGGNILVNGSAQLVQALAEHNLVDEYRLMVYPVILGAGKRLFGDKSAASTLRLAEVRPVGPDGVMVMTYHPA